MAHQVTATNMGVALSLMTESEAYPRNALVRATVRIENVSREPVTVGEFRRDSPQIIVADAAGEVRGTSIWPFPNGPFASGGPRPSRHTTLQAGETISTSILVIASAEYLQARATLVFPSGQNQWQPLVHGERLRLTLFDVESPRVILREEPSLQAEIIPLRSVQGPLLYQYWLSSKTIPGSTHGMTASGSLQWIAADGATLALDWHTHSPFEREWHVVAGWENWPVARIDYIYR